jgi:hypothetical protein
MWSPPRHVVKRQVNSYKLETLDGAKLEGEFSARRLREFVPREGTDLAEAQRVHMSRIRREEGERIERERMEVDELRGKDQESITTPNVDSEETNRSNIGPGFFYDDEEEGEREREGEGIADRVSRRRGRRHEGGGQME